MGSGLFVILGVCESLVSDVACESAVEARESSDRDAATASSEKEFSGLYTNWSDGKCSRAFVISSSVGRSIFLTW